MPTYAYSCTKCGEEFEVYQTFSDAPLKRHPGCGGSVQKVFAPVGIVLKGSGFYKNDSGSRSKSKSSSKSESSETKTETKSESTSKSESSSSKSDAKANGNGSKAKPASKAAK
jgi:putative FmdB family regulatory protein